MSSSLHLPSVTFTERDWRREIDLRRWWAGERNTVRRRSPIQGFGSFATRLIPRGGIVLVREPLTGHFPVNHSERPNTARARNRAGLFALRDIQAGEEITEDYRYLPYFEQALPVLPHVIERATVEEYERLLRCDGFALQAGRPGALTTGRATAAPAAAALSHRTAPPPCARR